MIPFPVFQSPAINLILLRSFVQLSEFWSRFRVTEVSRCQVSSFLLIPPFDPAQQRRHVGEFADHDSPHGVQDECGVVQTPELPLAQKNIMVLPLRTKRPP
jgi:hypothetical protein